MSQTVPPRAYRTVVLPVDVLVPPAKNPNRMPPGDFDALVANVREAGFLQPILARGEAPPREPVAGDPPEVVEELLAADTVWRLRSTRLEVVDGAHRLRAAVACGMTAVPCVVGPFSDREAKLLQVGMNRLRGELDLGAVARVLDELSAEGAGLPDLALSGYPEAEIEALLAAMRPDPEDLADVGAVGGPEEPAEEPAGGAWTLEVVFETKKELGAARRKLRKLGGGDLRRGLLKALDEEGD
jgi:ParB-like chromosome segregation protein Spo0J